jgi:hypothetical protein
MERAAWTTRQALNQTPHSAKARWQCQARLARLQRDSQRRL